MQLGDTHSGFLQSCLGVSKQMTLHSHGSTYRKLSHHHTAHLNAPLALTLLWGHLPGVLKKGEGKSNYRKTEETHGEKMVPLAQR